ncbi:hypothetical protein F442_22808 [Phytophthora nicotianae P10297]|uniref:Uncharacterized protein n=2 Tax=Phytophthora nicotianae TaxID=4792 RepID=W2Y147_PHYNI|nr:hypothetical protein F442_22808 [Phytophthora nicotianae P10297]
MIREHQRLEETLRRGLAAAKHTLVRDEEGQGLMVGILRLALQRERLSSQNTELRAALARHFEFQKRLSNTSFHVFNEDHSDSNDTGQERSHLGAMHSGNNPEYRDGGWWVHFADNSPPFYFYPFSRDIVDKSDPFDSKLTKHWPAESPVGTFMGWNLHQTKLFRDNNLPLLRVKLLKKSRCSIEDVYKVTCSQPKACRPTLAVPKNWGLNQRYDVTLQVLQVFDQATHLIVDNIPGPINLRYLCVARKTQWELKGGKRKMCLSMVTVDSEDNQRRRAASPSTNEVEWLTEGGMVLTLTELDGG